MKDLLTGEQIEAIKKLREVYFDSKRECLEEERRIWNEQIKPNFNEVITEGWIIMTQEVFDYIVELTEKLKDTIK